MREELAQAAHAEARVANPRGRLEDRIEELRDARTQLEAEHRTETVLHPKGSEALGRIRVNERILDQQLARNEAELTQMPEVGDSARRELAVAEGVLAERCEMAILAARLDPPAYVRNELGERPSDPAKQKTWDRGVSQIEGYVKSTESRVEQTIRPRIEERSRARPPRGGVATAPADAESPRSRPARS